MKNFFLLFFLLSIAIFGQPIGYYDSANGLNGYLLKTQLKKIIDANNDGLTSEYLAIDKGYAGLYTTYLTSDIDSYYENNGTIHNRYLIRCHQQETMRIL